MSPSPGASNPGSSKRHGIDPAAQAALEAAAEWMRGPAKEKTYFSSPIENAYYHRDLGTHPTSAPMAEVAAWLKERVPAESRPAVVEAYFDPSSWEPPKVPQDYPQRQVATCLEVFVVEAPPTDLLRGIKARYAQFAERPRGEFGAKPGERAFFRVPSVERVNLLLALLPSTPEVLEFEELLVTSMFSPQQRASWGRDFAVNCAGVLARLHEAGRFQEAMLTDLIRDHPPLLAVAASGYSTFGGDGYLVHAPLRGRFPAVAAAIACDRLAGVLAKMEPGTNEVLGDVKEFRGLPVWLTAVDVLYRRLQGAFDGADTEDAEAAGMLGERVLDRWAPGDLSEAEEGAAATLTRSSPILTA